MYVLAPNQIVEKFPYSIGDLRKDNPQVSFPRNPSAETLAAFNVFLVVSTGAQYESATQVANQEGCAYNAERQRWETTWVVRDKTADELQAEFDRKADDVRAQRNSKLAASDWTQLADSAADKAAWAKYRQALRDISKQAGFPSTIVWPEMP
jgi:hypothetical protein